MQLIRRFRQCKHHHLERHYHGKYTQKIDAPAQSRIHSGNIPCRHGSTQQNQKRGKQCDHNTVHHALYKGIVSEGHALDKVIKPGTHLPCRKGESIRLYIGVLFKRVYHYRQHRQHINDADHG